MKRTYKVTLFMIGIIVFIIFFLLCVFYNNTHIKIIDNIKLFKTESYLDLDSGYKFKYFLNDYVDLQEKYEVSEFIFKEYGKIISTHKYYTFYMVELKYDEQNYIKVINNLFSHENISSDNKFGDFVVVDIVNDDEFYRTNHACICYNEDIFTIRYILFLDFTDEQSEYIDIRKVLPWHLSSIDWNVG